MTIQKSVIGNHILYTGDCLEIMKILPKESVDLITDPPYNIGLDYGHQFKDNQTKKEYFKWLRDRLNQMVRVLAKNGSLYLINYPEINAYTMPFLDKKLKFRRWLTWHYPTNIGHSKVNWTRSQRSILFYTKSNEYTFNKNDILQPYKNPDVGKIKKRIAAGNNGRGPYDLLKIEDISEILHEPLDVLQINLLKNVCQDRRLEHPCQLPGELIKIFIKASSKENDTILDPFSGTFMVSAIAEKMKRKSIGIELNPDYVKIGWERLLSFA